jgi:hypothetical protein
MTVSEYPDAATISDAELIALALSADPAQSLDPDAVPLDIFLGQRYESLPDWYMAPVMVRHSSRGRRVVILVVVAAFLVIEAAGLCSTYGPIAFH